MDLFRKAMNAAWQYLMGFWQYFKAFFFRGIASIAGAPDVAQATEPAQRLVTNRNNVARLIAVLGAVLISTLLFLVFNWLNYDRAIAELKINAPSNRETFIPLGQGIAGSQRIKIVREKFEAPSNEHESWGDRSVLCDVPFVAERFNPPDTLQISHVNRYKVYKGTTSVLIIEMRVEKYENETSLIADLAWTDERVTESDGQLRVATSRTFRIPWWQESDLAKSNALATVERRGVFCYPSYPTSTTALVSWIKTHWVATISTMSKQYDNTAEQEAITLSAKEVRETIAPELERILGRDYGHLTTASPLMLMRCMNGMIQWVTFAAFVSMLVVAGARAFYNVLSPRTNELAKGLDQAAVVSDPKGQGESGIEAQAEHEIKEIEKRELAHEMKWGRARYSPSLRIWKGALSALRRKGDYGDVPEFLESYASLEEERLDSSRFFLRFLIGAMPALGFIGTVIGIPMALMETGKVLSDELAKQQSGVANVALSLAFAFDTTLIALVLALVGQYIYSRLSAAEDSVVHEARDKCLDTFVHSVESPGRSPISAPHARIVERDIKSIAEEAKKETDAKHRRIGEISDSPDYYYDALPQQSLRVYVLWASFLGGCVASAALLIRVLLSSNLVSLNAFH